MELITANNSEMHGSEGRKFDVPHPEFVAVGKGVVVVIGKNDRGQHARRAPYYWH